MRCNDDTTYRHAGASPGTFFSLSDTLIHTYNTYNLLNSSNKRACTNLEEDYFFKLNSFTDVAIDSTLVVLLTHDFINNFGCTISSAFASIYLLASIMYCNLFGAWE